MDSAPAGDIIRINITKLRIVEKQWDENNHAFRFFRNVTRCYTATGIPSSVSLRFIPPLRGESCKRIADRHSPSNKKRIVGQTEILLASS